MSNPMVEEAKGNQFGQSIYDGVTIKANKSKYQSIAMQFTDRKWRKNHVVALAFRNVTNSTKSATASLVKDMTLERTQFNVTSFIL